MSPTRSRLSHRCFCAGVAYSAKVRIGPKLPNCTTSAERGQAAATSSMAMTASISVPPTPPSASGSVMPISPCACMRLAMSNGKRGSCARLSAPGASSAHANLRTDSANIFCSSVKSKFMGLSLDEPGPSHGHGLLPPPLAGEGWGGGMHDGSGNRLQHALLVCHDLVIVEPQYSIAFRTKKRIALCVAPHFLSFVVLPAIDFDDEHCRVAHKINNERTNRYLTPKACTVEPMRADRLPDNLFGFGHVAAKPARTAALFG